MRVLSSTFFEKYVACIVMYNVVRIVWYVLVQFVVCTVVHIVCDIVHIVHCNVLHIVCNVACSVKCNNGLYCSV